MSANFTLLNAIQNSSKSFSNWQKFQIVLKLLFQQQPIGGCSLKWGFEWSLLAGLMVKLALIALLSYIVSLNCLYTVLLKYFIFTSRMWKSKVANVQIK